MKKILFLLAVAFFAFQLTSFASITVSDNTGIIKIVPPNGGAPIVIKAGQPVPAIADGSTIVIVTGELKVATTAPSTVNLSTRGNTISLVPGSSVQVTLNANGSVKVYDANGVVDIKTSNGKAASLKTGQTIVIAGNIEAYNPPAFNPGPVNTQVQIDNHRKDYSGVGI